MAAQMTEEPARGRSSAISVGGNEAPAAQRTEDGGRRGTTDFVEFGGAALVERLLVPGPDEKPVPWRAVLGLVKDARLYPHCFAVWAPSKGRDKDAPESWRRAPPDIGYGDWNNGRPSDDVRGREAPPVPKACPRIAPKAPQTADVVVVDDAGAGFREDATCRPACLAGVARPPRALVWKMSGDLGGGALWDDVQKAPALAKRTVLVVTAADLRRAGCDVSRGLSWERTALDVVAALRETAIVPLRRCRHVVVSFEGAGALWTDRSIGAEPRATLVFDPARIEADPAESARGKVFGHQACLAAGIAWELASALADGAKDALAADAVLGGVRRGLAARRVLHAAGHGPADAAPSGFPAQVIRAHALRDPSESFACIEFPRPEDPDTFTILVHTAPVADAKHPLYADARLIAMNGVRAASAVPSFRMAGFATWDRREIESLRRIQRLIRDYENAPPPRKDELPRPLSIAVFGAPGAGKSFIVKQIAKGSFEKAPPFVEMNLSQFYAERELIGAFHRVRDAVLTGRTPVVLWDEFDSREYAWFRLLLAAMQDGTFQEEQVVHPIGKCVFVFAGGTSSTFSEFGRPLPDDPDASRIRRQWRFAKGPDFVSRLSGHLDVLGPNQRMLEPTRHDEDPIPDPDDRGFPIRRALFLRGYLALNEGEPPPIAPELVDMLLRVQRYRHGSRSFERILAALRNGNPPWTAEALTGERLAADVEFEA